MVVNLNAQGLAKLLRAAADAHHEYEQGLAVKPDPNWPEWYAAFVVQQLHEED